MMVKMLLRILSVVWLVGVWSCSNDSNIQPGTIERYLSDHKKENALKVLTYHQKAEDKVGPFCKALNQKFKIFNWEKIECDPHGWKVGGVSVQGRPLLYAEFGDLKAEDVKTTLILCGVHGDEMTSIYLCFSIYQMEILRQPLQGRKVVIAPMVNPDGFFNSPRATRTNANGVDLNRNFATQDWEKMAVKEWTRTYSKDKRKFPGDRPNSEPETLFQVHLMNYSQPDKIMSAHAPLKFIDYDGPADQAHFGLERRENRARFLAMNISKNTRFPLVDYRFFPGSLGNYAGKENGIPTYTLELPSSRPSKAKWIWKRFEYSLTKAIWFDVTDIEPEAKGMQMTNQED